VGLTVDVLFAILVSGSFAVMVAVLAYVPEALTVATISIVAVSPLERLPIFQFGGDHVPIEGFALTKT
jgi:hypothetical protein